jgi:hypothetical protein
MYIPTNTCPNCGYCPHCGRGGHQFQPYQQPWQGYPQPYLGDLPGWMGNGQITGGLIGNGGLIGANTLS